MSFSNARLINYFLCFLMLFGCGNSVVNGEVINAFGTYEVNNKFTLDVRNEKGIVVYFLMDENNKIIIKSFDRASVYQGWIIVFDRESLWFASSDIGVVAWVKNDEGKYVQHEFNNIQFIRKNAPNAIASFVEY